MDLGIAGRKAIVCASSKGLGRGCAEALAEAGCELVINGRNRDTVESTAATIRQRYGATVTGVACDVSTPEGRAALLEACPSPDILVNNNGGPPRRNFQDLDRDAILAGVTQNMITPIELILAVLGGMTERRWGRIVNITSSSVLAPIPGLELSSGARAGLTGFLAGVARQVAAQGVTINQLLPGKINTDRHRSLVRLAASEHGTSEEEEDRKAAAQVPVRRLGTPEEFGQVCAFMCSAHAGYLVGQNILLDGGITPLAF